MTDYNLRTDKDRAYRDETVLRRLFNEENLMAEEIADICDCGAPTIYKWANRFDIDTSRDKPYQDEDTLRRLYHDEFLTVSEVAEELDTAIQTIQRWMDKLGVEKRGPEEMNVTDKRLLNADLIREKYHDEGLTIRELADEWGVGHMAVHNAMKRYDIERRDTAEYNRTGRATHHITEYGYELSICAINNKEVRIHRLVAVAECGFDAVCDRVVHHRNGIPWDNRPENLEVMKKTDHVKHHFDERGGLRSWQGD